MGRRELNKQRKREALETQGLALFLEHGYDRTSIEQIATAAGVARGTFYLYFRDKIELFETLVDRWFDPVLELLQQVHDGLEEATDRTQSLEIYQEMAAGLAMMGLAYPKEVLIVFQESRHAGEAGEAIRAREVQLQEAVTMLTVLAGDRGLITVGNPRVASLVIMGAVERLYYEYLQGTAIGDPLQLATEVVGIFAKVLELPAGTLLDE